MFSKVINSHYLILNGERIEGDIAYQEIYRIARTEGHRIQNQSAMDAAIKVKDKGADIVKQWDATLDARTRPHHALLD